jgi:tetratricopeptide (TPR) repeat protein
MIAIGGFLAYSSALSNGFVLDDQTLIVNNIFLRQWNKWWVFFVAPISVGGGVASPFYRPLQPLLYLMIYHLAGLKPLLFHAVNIVLHSANACLVYILGKKLGFKSVPTLMASLLWALHPVHVEAVVYASATADVLYAFFSLLGLIVVTPFFTQRQIYLSVPLFVLGLLSKETAVVFPLLALITSFLTVSSHRSSTLLRFWPLALVTVAYLALRQSNPIFANFDLFNAHDACTNHLSCRTFTFLATLPAYIRLLVWPYGLHAERSFPSFESFWDLQVIVGFGFLGLTLWLTIKARTVERLKPAAWGLLWFLAADFPQSGLLFPLNGAFMEHWLYVPSIGLFLAAAQMLSARTSSKETRVFVALYGAFIVGCATTTYQQTKDWRDPITFYNHIIAYPDHVPRANVSLATLYISQGDMARATDQIKQAIILSHDTSPQAEYVYGTILYRQAQTNTDIENAIGHFQRALELYPNSFQFNQALANAYAELGDVDRALSYQKRADIMAAAFQQTYLPTMLRPAEK